MELSFEYIIFQANPDRGSVIYWRDGSKKKEVLKRDDFLALAGSINNGKNYSDIHNACNTYSFYLWDSLDSKVIHLAQKVDSNEALKYPNSLMTEINKVKNNTSYSSQKSIEQMKNMNRDKTYDMFESYGFEKPRTELIPLMSKTINDYVESDTFFSRVKQIFKEK